MFEALLVQGLESRASFLRILYIHRESCYFNLMADAGSDDDSPWELPDELTAVPSGTKRKLSDFMREKEVAQKQKVCKTPKQLPLLKQPVTSWDCVPTATCFFTNELEHAIRRYGSFKANCLSKGIEPVPLNDFAFNILCQTGWIVKDGKFSLVGH